MTNIDCISCMIKKVILNVIARQGRNENIDTCRASIDINTQLLHSQSKGEHSSMNQSCTGFFELLQNYSNLCMCS